MSKYNSTKIDYDGHIFDSKVEMEYYKYLVDEVNHEKIKSFSLQPTYILIPVFEKMGKNYRSMNYTPDFLIEELDGTMKLVDVKGFATQQSLMRKKLFDYYFRDIELIWLTYVKKYGGWIEIDDLKKERKKNKKEK